jgi:hypothetical protein
MLQFIVLGQIPGTHLQVDFTLLVNIFGALMCGYLGYVLLRRALRRYFEKKFSFIRLELISL